MTGDFVSAEDALAMGMINKIVESDKLLDAAIDYAELLASGPRDAVVWTKYCVNKLVKQNAHLLLDTSTALETLTFNSPERREAVASFAEKRKRFGDNYK
jgi:enoyl-CoA hydratase/carnithine racemase